MVPDWDFERYQVFGGKLSQQEAGRIINLPAPDKRSHEIAAMYLQCALNAIYGRSLGLMRGFQLEAVTVDSRDADMAARIILNSPGQYSDNRLDVRSAIELLCEAHRLNGKDPKEVFTMRQTLQQIY